MMMTEGPGIGHPRDAGNNQEAREQEGGLHSEKGYPAKALLLSIDRNK